MENFARVTRRTRQKATEIVAELALLTEIYILQIATSRKPS